MESFSESLPHYPVEEEESRERMDAGPEVTSRKRPAEDDGDRPMKFYRPSQDSDKTLVSDLTMTACAPIADALTPLSERGGQSHTLCPHFASKC